MIGRRMSDSKASSQTKVLTKTASTGTLKLLESQRNLSSSTTSSIVPNGSRMKARRRSLCEELEKRKAILTEEQIATAVKNQKVLVDRLAVQDSGGTGLDEKLVNTSMGETLTVEQIQSLKSTFKKLDTDKDGKISKKDLRIACRKLGVLLTKDELEDMMQQEDADGGSDHIGYKAYEKLVGHQLVIANYKNKQMEAAFKKFDINGDGFITGDEIRSVFKSNGVDLDDHEITELIKEADADGDGVICFEEFVQSVCEKDW